MYRTLKCLVGLLIVGSAHAQMPHEVLLLVNKNSQASKQAANMFVTLRQIPRMNVVYLDIPENAYGGTAAITPEEFTELIWEPANAEARKRGLDDQILAWVYSVDFPIRVKTDKNDRRQMSVGGLTFLRNKIPGPSLVEEGKYLSRLFLGPNQRLKLSLNAMSLGVLRDGLGMDAQVAPEASYLKSGLGEAMPLPSMMLGYIGEKGSSIDTVVETIKRGRGSDYRGYRKGIYFVVSDDVRSKCREWQYYPAVNELKQRGVEAVVTTNFPVGAENVVGLLMGAENVDPSAVKSFVPGAMTEHLTSWSAEFQKPQTKATAWLDAGATASAGSVVEPYSNPDKFPSARFYVHYVSGATMLESFYQSIACPLQNLLLGDPLAKPYAVPVAAEVLGANRIDRDFTYFLKAQCRIQNARFLYTFLLDGKVIRGASDDPTVYIRSRKLADGYHELCGVAMLQHTVQFSAMDIKPFVVDLMGRSVSIEPNTRKIGTHEHGVKVKVEGMETPEMLKLVSGLQVLDEQPYASDAELVLNELKLGEGPNRMRIIAVYADGMEVSSEPIDFGIEFSSEP